MIQNFDVQGGPEFGRTNLPLLRDALALLRLDGFIVPHEDEYQNEYLPDCNERLLWVSGFTGSAGSAIILEDDAAIFVDGRYTLQVKAQVDPDLFSFHPLENSGLAQWMAKHLERNQKIGYDSRLLTPTALAHLQKGANQAGAKLVALGNNPIDSVWTDRPKPPRSLAYALPLSIAGRTHKEKRTQIAQLLTQKSCDAAIITSPASIAWLLNIRGNDVMCTPLTLCTAVIYADGHVDLLIHKDKIDAAMRAHLGPEVSLKQEANLEKVLASLNDKTVWLDPGSTSAYIFESLETSGAKIHSAMDPIALPKAQKNKAEIAGTEAAHMRDGVALVKFLHWLDTAGQTGQEDEISAAQMLEEFRREDKQLKDLSFESISGAGPNGAIVHYRVNRSTNLKLSPGSLYLIDSGGQYPDGTTDVTRTVAIGKPSAEMIRHYTLVLKGHIALAVIRFPKGTTGHALDVLARMALWQEGLDYDHGTGHGVGVFLGVHEGPQRISKSINSVPLLPGMIVSNEPGFYKTNHYGIRIENLQYVHEARPIQGGEREMLGFTNLTFAPLDKNLIDPDLLTQTERDWVNDYHAQIWTKLKVHLDGDVKDWLKRVCAPLERKTS